MLTKISRNNYFQFLLITTLIFTFYLFCMPKIIALEDDGIFVLAFYFNGVSHPPGYPLHTLLGYFFTHLPFGNPAANAHALSALFSGLSGSLIFFITKTIGTNYSNRNFVATIAVFAYTLSSGVWSQSIIAEVYTLNVFLFLLALYLTLKIYYSLDTKSLEIHNNSTLHLKRNFFFLSLTCGLALANHWPIFILGATGIFYILLKDYKFIATYWFIILAGIIIGLTPYIWLYINSNSDTFIKFFGPIETFGDLIDYISRKNFNKTTDFSSTATITDKANFFLFTLKQLGTQWGNLNTVFIPLGIFMVYKNRIIHPRITTGLLISFISSSLLLSLILGYDFNEYKKSDLLPFLILAHSIGAIFFAYGVSSLLAQLKILSGKDLKFIIASLILLQTLTANFPKNYRANYLWTSIYAQLILDMLKPDSTLFVTGDISTGVIGYWHFIKNQRPDITVIQDQGLIINGNRLFNPRVVSKETRKEIIRKYITTSKNPAYFTKNEFNFGVNDYWLVYEYNKDLKDGQQHFIPPTGKLEQFFHYVFSDITITDKWTKHHRENLRIRAIPHLLSNLDETTPIEKRNKILKYISKINSNLKGLTITLYAAETLNKTNLIGSRPALIKKAWNLYENETNKQVKANFLNLLAQFSLDSGDTSQGRKYYKMSVKVWNHKDNIAHRELQK